MEKSRAPAPEAPKAPELKEPNEQAEVAEEAEKAISTTEAKAIGQATAASAEARKSQADIVEAVLPDGTTFRGTSKEYNEAVRDYFDNLGR